RLAGDSNDHFLKKEMSSAAELLVMSGKTLLLASQKLQIQPCLEAHREELVTSAQKVLQGTLKILLIEDNAGVRKIVQAAHQLLDCLTQVESARDMSELLISFKGFTEALLLLKNLVEGRIQELKDPVEQQHLDHTLETLKKCIPMLHTATHTSLKYPMNNEVRISKKYVMDQIDALVTELVYLLESDSQSKTHQDSGLFSQQMYQLLEVLSNSKCSIITDTDFNSIVEAVVFYCMLIADKSRPKLELQLVKHCRCLLLYRSKISEAESVSNSPWDFDFECNAMKREVDDLQQTMTTAIIYQILDTFTETNVPLEELLKAALEATTEPSSDMQTFHTHADHMLRVAAFVSATCTKAKNIQDIQSSVACLDKFCADILPILLDLTRRSDNSEVFERLQVFYHKWVKETENLLVSFNDVINVHEFIDILIQEIMKDKGQCKESLEAQNSNQFTQHSANLIGRAKHIVLAAKRHIDNNEDPIFRNGLLVLSTMLSDKVGEIKSHLVEVVEIVQLASNTINPFSNKKSILHPRTNENITQVHTKLKKVQTNTRKLKESLFSTTDHLCSLTGEKKTETQHLNYQAEEAAKNELPDLETRKINKNVTVFSNAISYFKEETDKWEDGNNKILQVAKQMAAQMIYMAQFLKNQGPIQSKEEFIASAKQIASSGQTFVIFANMIAKYCLDRRCAMELLCAVKQIPTFCNQLSIISR
uniref:Uncharacterized protein n=1 Tax=Latimeria chalumnae TaxID=7897 RepID=H3AU51_LATCH